MALLLLLGALHMLDFRELELPGDEGGVWYDQL